MFQIRLTDKNTIANGHFLQKRILFSLLVLLFVECIQMSHVQYDGLMSNNIIKTHAEWFVVLIFDIRFWLVVRISKYYFTIFVLHI